MVINATTRSRPYISSFSFHLVSNSFAIKLIVLTCAGLWYLTDGGPAGISGAAVGDKEVTRDVMPDTRPALSNWSAERRRPELARACTVPHVPHWQAAPEVATLWEPPRPVLSHSDHGESLVPITGSSSLKRNARFPNSSNTRVHLPKNKDTMTTNKESSDCPPFTVHRPLSTS